MFDTFASAWLAANNAAIRTGRSMYVYTLNRGRTWTYASGSWLEGMSDPLPETTEVRP